MSKSLGNFFTVREVLKRYKPEVVRFFIVSSHYRSPLNYSDQNLDNARAALDGFYLALRGLVPGDAAGEGEGYGARFESAMDDDFNTPEALAVLNELRTEINRAKAADNSVHANALGGVLVRLGASLGLLQQNPEDYFKSGAGMTVNAITENLVVKDFPAEVKVVVGDARIDDLVLQRTEARKRKDWAEADRVRKELDALGVILEDGPQGTTWRRK